MLIEDNSNASLQFVSTVIRLTYGIKSQKQAEVELHRVFFNVFNHAARKYRNDPHVKDFGGKKMSIPNRVGHPYDVAQMRSPMMQLLLPTTKECFMQKGYGRARPPKDKSRTKQPSPRKFGGDIKQRVPSSSFASVPYEDRAHESASRRQNLQAVKTPRERMEDGSHASLNV